MMKKRPSRPRSMVMAGEHEKAGLKARLGAYWNRLGVYQKKLDPARVVSDPARVVSREVVHVYFLKMRIILNGTFVLYKQNLSFRAER